MDTLLTKESSRESTGIYSKFTEPELNRRYDSYDWQILPDKSQNGCSALLANQICRQKILRGGDENLVVDIRVIIQGLENQLLFFYLLSGNIDKIESNLEDTRLFVFIVVTISHNYR